MLLVDVTSPEADQLDEHGRRRTADPTALRLRAYRTFAADVLRRRRPAIEATELLRLSLDPDWIAHQSTDQLLTPAEWHTAMTRAFPGATTGHLDGAAALHWRAPTAGPDARYPVPRQAT